MASLKGTVSLPNYHPTLLHKCEHTLTTRCHFSELHTLLSRAGEQDTSSLPSLLEPLCFVQATPPPQWPAPLKGLARGSLVQMYTKLQQTSCLVGFPDIPDDPAHTASSQLCL